MSLPKVTELFEKIFHPFRFLMKKEGKSADILSKKRDWYVQKFTRRLEISASTAGFSKRRVDFSGMGAHFQAPIIGRVLSMMEKSSSTVSARNMAMRV